MLFDLIFMTETLGSPVPTASRLETAGTLHGQLFACLITCNIIGRNASDCICSPLFLSGHLHNQHQHHLHVRLQEPCTAMSEKQPLEKEQKTIECEWNSWGDVII